MALSPPTLFPGTSCDFCKMAPATLVVNNHATCERHKNSKMIDLGSTSSSDISSTSSFLVMDNGDNDVVEDWKPPPPEAAAAAAAAAATVVAGSPPLTVPLFAPAHAGAVTNNSGNNRGFHSSISSPGSRRKPHRLDRAPLVPFPAAAPLALLLDGSSDEDDDDVVFRGNGASHGVLNLTGASASVPGIMNFGTSDRGDGGSSGNALGLPLSAPPLADSEIVDLSAFKAPRWHPPPWRPKSMGRAGSDGGERQLQQQPLIDTPENGVDTVRRRQKRRVERKIAAAINVDEIDITQETVAGARAVARERTASGGSNQPSIIDSALSAASQGQDSPQKKRRKRPKVECIVCFDRNPLDSCAQCSEGHAMCRTCVTSYVTQTLMPQGTVFWDRIKCGGSSTCGHLFGPSVQSLLPREVVKKIEIKQMDVAHLVAGERDPTSAKWISKHSKDCPNCGVPIQKSTGCMHMTCIMCRHQFWYDCDCKYPRHSGSCHKVRRY